MGTQQRVGPRNLLAASGSAAFDVRVPERAARSPPGRLGTPALSPLQFPPSPSCFSLSGRYLPPTFPLGAARPPPHSPSVRPQDPGSSCGSPSSSPRCSCRTPADYTSRRPPRHCHVTCLAPNLLAEGSLELRLPASRAAASDAGRCAVRISGGRSGQGCALPSPRWDRPAARATGAARGECLEVLRPLMPAQTAVWPGPEGRRPRRAYAVMRLRGRTPQWPGSGSRPRPP